MFLGVLFWWLVMSLDLRLIRDPALIILLWQLILLWYLFVLLEMRRRAMVVDRWIGGWRFVMVQWLFWFVMVQRLFLFVQMFWRWSSVVEAGLDLWSFISENFCVWIINPSSVWSSCLHSSVLVFNKSDLDLYERLGGIAGFTFLWLQPSFRTPQQLPVKISLPRL
jgi:hypothetical protein